MTLWQGVRQGRVLVVLAALAVLSAPGSAGAATAPTFSCTANAVTASVAGASKLNPITAGGDGKPCQAAISGLPNTGEALSLDSLITARTAYASVDPNGSPAYASKPAAGAGVEGLTVKLGTAPLVVSAANSAITSSCVSGAPKFTTASNVAGISLFGTPIVVDGVVQPITDALSDALGALVEVRLNEVVTGKDGSKTVRAARVTLIRGDKPLAEVIVAESKLGLNGDACNPDAGGDQPTPTPTNCPQGSVYDAAHKVCVIPAPGSQTPGNPVGDIDGPGSVIVGPPHTGPNGGTVISLVDAKKRFPKSPCVRGAGPKYVVVGTRKVDLIRGSNRADRVISLGGGDDVHARKGKDCVDAGKGSDEIWGQKGKDRMYGGRGGDYVNGGARSDLLKGGNGKDRINASQGPDKVYAGAGGDAINSDLANKRASVWAGKGRDRVRCNRRAVRRIHQAEVIHVITRLRPR